MMKDSYNAHSGSHRDKLRAVRTRRLLTQEELAERVGVSPSTVVNIERDNREPHFRTIRKLAKALDVQPKELVKARA